MKYELPDELAWLMEREPVSSSALASVGYDRGVLEAASFTVDLVVHRSRDIGSPLNGSVYQYVGVSARVYEALRT